MSKRLVLCCDGTWNTPDQVSQGRPCPTNVTKLALAVADAAEDGTKQCLFYHRGVGTSRWDRLIGGAFGFGLSRNVKDTYRFIVETFEPGDELFFFGFSRGAFTARSTAGLVRNAGILRREHADRLEEAYALYRDRLAHPRGTESQLFRRSYSHETPIHFIGVWDTVGALGIPLSGLRLLNAFNRRWQFHDVALSTTVRAAFQALAIDEKRGPFKPAVWQQQADAGDQRLEQVWFSGVHCDVGGGYQNGSLADVPLLWLAARAQTCGLSLRPDGFPAPPPATPYDVVVDPDPMGPLHESRKAFYRLLPPYDRPIGDADPAHEYAASTAILRTTEDSGYRPPGLSSYLKRNHQEMNVWEPNLVAGMGNVASGGEVTGVYLGIEEWDR
jgi:uncharacterized protein (DUF2235 family)